MYIKEIILKDFRNYKQLTLSFSDRVSFIIGPNGAGKTNILEAVTILSNLRSFRNINDSEIIRWGCMTFYCSCIVHDSHDTLFEVAYTRDKDIQKKRCKIDTIAKSSSDYYGRFLTVVLSPSDVQLIHGVPELRRKYFDSIISKYDTNYLIALMDFKKCLFNRNKLLKHFRDKGKQAQQELDVWDQIFAEKSSSIMNIRNDFIRIYNELFQKIYHAISHEEASPALKYRPMLKNASKDAIESELKKLRVKDIMFGTSTTGPQRDDYSLELEKILFKNYASQGQKRTAAIALKIAERDTIERIVRNKCVLLIDDIFSELDRERQNSFIDILKDDNQLILTMVDSNSLLNSSLGAGKVYHIDKIGTFIES